MSARKNAWEAKIAEQQTVANEHNRIMYRTRSATKVGVQKQQAEQQLRQGQGKEYDPAQQVCAYPHRPSRSVLTPIGPAGLCLPP